VPPRTRAAPQRCRTGKAVVPHFSPVRSHGMPNGSFKKLSSLERDAVRPMVVALVPLVGAISSATREKFRPRRWFVGSSLWRKSVTGESSPAQVQCTRPYRQLSQPQFTGLEDDSGCCPSPSASTRTPGSLAGMSEAKIALSAINVAVFAAAACRMGRPTDRENISPLGHKIHRSGPRDL
jgi:hypothetical protein